MENSTIPEGAKKFIYVGEILPGGINDNIENIHHRDFSVKHTKEMDLSGLLHKRNHNDKIPIGKVDASFMDEDSNTGEKFIIGHINVDDVVGNFTVQEEILKGSNLGLSLNHEYFLETFPGIGYHEKKIPLDVSSVDIPNSMRPNARIIFGCFDTDLERNKKRDINNSKMNIKTDQQGQNPSGSPQPSTPIDYHLGANPHFDVQSQQPSPSPNLAQSQQSSPSPNLAQSQQPPPPPTTTLAQQQQQPPPTTTTQQQLPPTTLAQSPQSKQHENMFTPENVDTLSQDQLKQLVLLAAQKNEAQRKQLEEQRVLAETLEAERKANWNENKEKLLEITRNIGGGDENAKALGCALDEMRAEEGQSFNSMTGQGKVLSSFVKCGTAFEETIMRQNEIIEQMKKEALKSETKEDENFRRMYSSFSDQRTTTPTEGRFMQNSASSAERQQFQQPFPPQQFQQPPPSSSQQYPQQQMQEPSQKRSRTEYEPSSADRNFNNLMMSHLQTGPPASFKN